MKNFIKEFKEFVMHGNVIDLAVGIVIGGAFQKIITSFVNDIVLASLKPIMKGSEFSNLKLWQLNIGNFISAALDFVIIAFCIFLLVKFVNTFRKVDDKVQNFTRQEKLLIEIRDLLKKQN
ncbi:MAG: large conductance mechanosensitive channel protein MscL [Patescibacteria group bacterium]|nr:large conductance mechanosensitive channel protein MscL [Patescibacteria group bacterium]